MIPLCRRPACRPRMPPSAAKLAIVVAPRIAPRVDRCCDSRPVRAGRRRRRRGLRGHRAFQASGSAGRRGGGDRGRKGRGGGSGQPLSRREPMDAQGAACARTAGAIAVGASRAVPECVGARCRGPGTDTGACATRLDDFRRIGRYLRLVRRHELFRRWQSAVALQPQRKLRCAARKFTARDAPSSARSRVPRPLRGRGRAPARIREGRSTPYLRSAAAQYACRSAEVHRSRRAGRGAGFRPARGAGAAIDLRGICRRRRRSRLRRASGLARCFRAPGPRTRAGRADPATNHRARDGRVCR